MFIDFQEKFYFFHWIIITIIIISVYLSKLTRFVPDWSKILELLLNNNFFGLCKSYRNWIVSQEDILLNKKVQIAEMSLGILMRLLDELVPELSTKLD